VLAQGADAPRSENAVDLFTLVGQFTALRHEVNMQTRAARAAVEQNAEVLKQLAYTPSAPAASADEELRPLLKSVVDVADVLALSHRQMERLRESAEPLLDDLTADPPPEPDEVPGFFARLFGAKPQPETPPGETAKQAAEKLRQLVVSVTDGYAMSLRRIERVLPTFGLERLSVTDTPYDPEIMEVVEVVDAPDRPPGTVVEEVRPGYRRRGNLFRSAQVRVAR
jgi:molecular chaperone GrpE